MTSLTDIDGSVFAYEFDGEGNRLSQSLNDCLSKRFVYDGADVLLELNPTNGVAYAWVNGPGIDQPIERLLFIDGAPRARRVFNRIVQIDDYNYWEVWEVHGDGEMLPNDRDTFKYDATKVGLFTKGTADFSAFASFHPGQGIPAGFSMAQGKHPAGDLPQSSHPPNLPVLNGGVTHRASIRWDCCSSPKRSTFSVR